MNYQVLKNLIDSLVATFKCPNCQSEITSSNLEIVGAAGTTINLDIICQSCKKHTFVKAEMTQLNLGNIVNFNKNTIDKIKNNLTSMKKEMTPNISILKEKEIIDLKNVLNQDNIKVQDLLK